MVIDVLQYKCCTLNDLKCEGEPIRTLRRTGKPGGPIKHEFKCNSFLRELD